MLALPTLATPSAVALVAAGIDATVKAGVVAGVAAALAWLLRRAPARVRYRVWLGALMVTALAVCLALMNAVLAEWRGGYSALVALPADAVPASIWRLVVWGWALGALAHAGRTAVGLVLLARDRQRLPIAAERTWRRLVKSAGASLGLRGDVRILYGADDAIPMCWGLVRGTILVPARAARWTRRLRQAVVLHECAHLRRRDPLVMLAEQIVSALLWFHPAIWIIVAHLRRERELACDATVVAAGVRPDVYARLLVTLARSCRPLAAPAHAIVQTLGLEYRIAALLAGDVSGVPARHQRVALTVGVVFALFTVTRVIATTAPLDGVAATLAPRVTAQPGESPASFRAGLFGAAR